MNQKGLQWIAISVLIFGCWLTSTLLWGNTNPGGVISLSIIVIFIVLFLTRTSKWVDHWAWIVVGVFLFVICFIPAPIIARYFPIRDAEPFGSSLAITLLVMYSLSILIASFLLSTGLNLVKTGQRTSDSTGEDIRTKPEHHRLFVFIILTLSILLVGGALYHTYWFYVWDSTYDSLGFLWLPIPILATGFSGFILFRTLQPWKKVVSLSYLLLIPVILFIYTQAQRVDFRRLTKKRADFVSRTLANYYVKKGQFPKELRQMTPFHTLFLPGPVILYGQDWCYDGGYDYFRLGYVDRFHWSDPRLFGNLYEEKGEIPDLSYLCEAEIAVIQKRYPDYPYEFWIKGE